jgi:hypothetical protein
MLKFSRANSEEPVTVGAYKKGHAETFGVDRENRFFAAQPKSNPKPKRQQKKQLQRVKRRCWHSKLSATTNKKHTNTKINQKEPKKNQFALPIERKRCLIMRPHIGQEQQLFT